jgi:hypothetical protein
MRNITRPGSYWMLVVTVVATFCWFLIFSNHADAQSQGNNAVYNSSGNCFQSSQCAGSAAFIDASVFTSKATDFCGVLKYVLANVDQPPTYPSGAVIDARGLKSGNTSMTCTASPWAGITLPPPSNILLPAGTIVIPSTWKLPPSTHLIGAGSNITSSGFTPGTTLAAQSGFTGTAMISFGSSSLCTSTCTGIAVENLTLNGQSQAIDGIDNTLSQDLSYVDHVGLYRIVGTGLSVSGNAKNSGPYTNITFDLGGASGSSSTHCASINGLTSTRGIRNLTCISESSDLPAAVLLDSSSNLLKDLSIAGFYDGILVGANAPAQSNVLVNIIGDTSMCHPICPVPIRAIHISSNQTAGSNNVSELSIMGVGNDTPTGTYTIWDDLTGAQIIDPSAQRRRAAPGKHAKEAAVPCSRSHRRGWTGLAGGPGFTRVDRSECGCPILPRSLRRVGAVPERSRLPWRSQNRSSGQVINQSRFRPRLTEVTDSMAIGFRRTWEYSQHSSRAAAAWESPARKCREANSGRSSSPVRDGTQLRYRRFGPGRLADKPRRRIAPHLRGWATI